ncbi:hypothetical protein H4R18_003022 [Coemansia javaensis]|uniref:Uncharacterized protein n=1 Tax=Coemansia javaensis TaxID=2761396 RepID=A0A9W8HA47_9FUNG|nr:hypothetical protein H4R18_003022 [Coemansia javaensis]
MERLPEHIVEAVACHVASFPAHAAPRDARTWHEPQKEPALVPLMGACRSWRRAVCPLFYRAAVLELPTYSTAPRDRCALYAADAADRGWLRRVCQIHVEIDVAQFDECWDAGPRCPAAAVRRHGQLPSVRSVHVRFRLPRMADRERMVELSGDAHRARRADSNVRAFVDAVLETMPDAHCVGIGNQGYHMMDRELQASVRSTLKGAHRLVGPRTIHLELSNVGSGDLPTVCSEPAPPLRSITIAQGESLLEHVELVRRCADTLESLDIGWLRDALIAPWLHSSEDPDGVQRYPRLRHLSVNCRISFRAPTPWRPAANPFPRLETLVCPTNPPFSIAAVLLETRKQLRHLDICADLGLMVALFVPEIGERGALPGLRYLSLEVGAEVRGIGGVVRRLMCWAAQAGPAVHTVRLLGFRVPDADHAMVTAGLSGALRTLDLNGTPLTLDEAMATLRACPGLLKLRLAIIDASDAQDQIAQSDAEIRQYQELHGCSAFSVRYLGLDTMGYADMRTAGLLALLLAGLLPSVARVTIIPVGPGPHDSLLQYIRDMRRNVPYDKILCSRVVRFFVGRDW